MKKSPNILFIFSDQQRWDTVSCYGQPLGGEVQTDAQSGQTGNGGDPF